MNLMPEQLLQQHLYMTIIYILQMLETALAIYGREEIKKLVCCQKFRMLPGIDIKGGLLQSVTQRSFGVHHIILRII